MIQDENIMETQEIGDKKKKSIQKWPKVAIIILNWNGWKDTIECLESVFRNTYSNYQVIVVDNGSTDGSMEKIKAWAQGKQEVLTPEPSHPLYHLSHPAVKKPIPYIYYSPEEAEEEGNFKREKEAISNWKNKNDKLFVQYPLILIQTGENLGYAGGNNIGIKYVLSSSVKYVFILNNDIVIQTPNIIELLTGSLEKINKGGIIGPRIFFYKNPRMSLDIYKSIFFKFAARYYLLDKNINNKVKDEVPIPVEIVDRLIGCALFISRKVFEEIGFFDERFFMYCEENDFCIRAQLRGFLVLHTIEKVSVLHKTIEKYSNPLPLQAYYSTRNMMFLIENSFSGKKKIYLIILYFLSFIRRQLVLLRNRKFSSFRYSFRGFIDGFLHKYGKFGL